MYFDYLVLAFIAYGIGDAFFGWGDESSDEDDSETPIAPETDLEDGDMTQEPDTDSDEVDTPDETDEEDDYVYVSGPTTVTVETDGETATSTFDDVEFGLAPTVTGTDERDIMTSSDETGFEVNLDAGAGDDAISFGFGASVDSGEGNDVMDLTVTRNALASDNGAGTIDLTDDADSLSVTFEATTPEFVHTVRGQSTSTVDGVAVQTDWIDYYVSDRADISDVGFDDNNLYDSQDTTRVFRAVIGEGSTADPAVINADPSIIVNRTVSSSVNLTDG